MKLRIQNQPDFLSGIAFAVVGTGFVVAATQYEFGSAAEMGPSQFPVLVGGLLAVFGIVIAVRSLSPVASQEKLEPVALKPILLTLGAVVLFGALLLPFGLVVASVALVVVSALASHEFHWRYALFTAAALTAGCYLIFVFGLGLPMPVLPGDF